MSVTVANRISLVQCKSRTLLTGPASTKQTYHIVLQIPTSLVHFPGDSLAVFPQNDPEAVEQQLREMGASGDEPFFDPRAKETLPLRDYLLRKVDLVTGKPLLPRFYSIASSAKQHPAEIHLTVLRTGVCSRYLCHFATEVSCYVQHARAFALPTDLQTPIIMIGPGTGVAPFRAFLQERMATQALGKNWLFFGERNRATDFYYADFWQELQAQNCLRLDLAFSRDQAEKDYVQHRLYEAKAEIWAWIQQGCHLYICGDKERMAKEVEQMLQRIIEEEGALSPEEARLALRTLRREKRYLLDVY